MRAWLGRTAAFAALAVACGRVLEPGVDEETHGVVDYGSDAGSDAGADTVAPSTDGGTAPVDSGTDVLEASTDAADAGQDAGAALGTDPCVVYRADQEVDNRYELYLSCLAPNAAPAIQKLNAPITNGGDVQSLVAFGAQPATGVAHVAFLVDGQTVGQNELHLARIEGGMVSPLGRVSADLDAGFDVFSARFSADGKKLVYLTTNVTTGRLYSVDLSGAAPAPAVFVDLDDAGAPVLPISVTSFFFVSDKLFFKGQETLGQNEWYSVTWSGQTPNAPMRVTSTPPLDSAPLLVAPNPSWAIYGAYGNNVGLEGYLVDLRGPAPASPVKLTPQPFALGGAISEVKTHFTGESDGVIAFLADAVLNDQTELFVARLAGGSLGATEKVNAALPAGGDVAFYALSPDGKRVVYEADALDTSAALYASNVETSPITPARVSHDAGVVDGFEFGSNTGLVYRTPAQPGDGICSVYVADLTSGSGPFLVTPSGFGSALGVLLGVPKTGKVYFSTRNTDTIDLEEIDVSVVPPAFSRISGALPAGGSVRTATASADGKAIFYRASATQGNPNLVDLFRVDVTAPAKTPVKMTGAMVAGGSVLGYTPVTLP